MRQIGSLSDQKQAQLFSDYLLSRQIKTQLDQDDAAWIIWVRDEDQLDEARTLLDEFRENPTEPRYREGASKADGLRLQERRSRTEKLQRSVDVRRDLWSQPTARKAPLTMVLAITCVVVAMGTGLGEKPNSEMMRSLSFADPVARRQMSDTARTTAWRDIRRGQVWRLITPIFIHNGLAHIAFNMIWLFSLGALIEVRRSSAMLSLVVLASAIGGNVGQAMFTGPNFCGMSGVVYGLLGFIWIRMYLAPGDGLRLSRDYILIMMIWLVLGFLGVLDRAFDIRIANAAHLCGLMSGILVAIVLPVRHGGRQTSTP